MALDMNDTKQEKYGVRRENKNVRFAVISRDPPAVTSAVNQALWGCYQTRRVIVTLGEVRLSVPDNDPDWHTATKLHP